MDPVDPIPVDSHEQKTRQELGKLGLEFSTRMEALGLGESWLNRQEQNFPLQGRLAQAEMVEKKIAIGRSLLDGYLSSLPTQIERSRSNRWSVEPFITTLMYEVRGQKTDFSTFLTNPIGSRWRDEFSLLWQPSRVLEIIEDWTPDNTREILQRLQYYRSSLNSTFNTLSRITAKGIDAETLQEGLVKRRRQLDDISQTNHGIWVTLRGKIEQANFKNDGSTLQIVSFRDKLRTFVGDIKSTFDGRNFVGEYGNQHKIIRSLLDEHAPELNGILDRIWGCLESPN